MHRPVTTVREGDTRTAALLVLLREPINRLVVADDDGARPVGMVTPFDLLHLVAAEGAGSGGRVRGVASPKHVSAGDRSVRAGSGRLAPLSSSPRLGHLPPI